MRALAAAGELAHEGVDRLLLVALRLELGLAVDERAGAGAICAGSAVPDGSAAAERHGEQDSCECESAAHDGER